MRYTVNYTIFRVISARFHVKDSIPYLNDYSLCTYISPQIYLGNFLYVKAEICPQCSLGRWCGPEHLLVSHTVLAGHLELASDFQFHICIKKAVSLRSSADKISNNGYWFVVFHFSVPLIFGCPRLRRLKSNSLLPSMIIRLLFCISAGTLRCRGTQNH